MNPTIKATTKQAASIIKATFPEYKGRKINVEFTSRVNFYDTNWDGGTKNIYKVIASNGKTVSVNVPAPWVNAIEGTSYPLGTDALVVERSYFCGKDCGITIYANPCHMPKWIEA